MQACTHHAYTHSNIPCTYHSHVYAHAMHTHHEHTRICHAHIPRTHTYAMHTHHEHTHMPCTYTMHTHHASSQLHTASAVPPPIPTLFMIFSKHREDSQGPGGKCWGHSAVLGGQSVRRLELKPNCPCSPNGSHCGVPYPGCVFLVVTWRGHSCWADSLSDHPDTG